MRFAAILAFAASAFAARLAPLLAATNAVENEFIVVLKDDLSTSSFAEHKSWLFDQLRQKNVVRTNNFYNVQHFYDFESFKGYAIAADSDFVTQLRTLTEVDYIEEVQLFTTQAVQNSPPSWGLDRTSQRNLPLDGKFFYSNNAGKGVDVYVIDTGININHEDFGGRAKWGYTAPSGESATDGNGHGTHVAGTIVGTKYGIAKQANVFAVKVLRSSGTGTTTDVIKGIEWVAKNARKGFSVANMSLGGGKSTAVDNAVEAGINAGVVFVVAAGNDAGNACNSSPAAAPNAITVGATTKTDALASFSNRGTCVDINAPGQDITSVWIGSNSATKTISGTSMASPHVAGVSALFLGDLPASAARSPKDVKSLIIASSTKSVLSGIPAGTPNSLLFDNPPTSF